MFNLRRRMLKKLGNLFLTLDNILLPFGGDNVKFKRFRLERRGWFWLVFPRLVLEPCGEVDLSDVYQRFKYSIEKRTSDLTGSMRDQVKSAAKRSVINRSGIMWNKLDEGLNDIVKGSKELPSIIVTSGHNAAQRVQRSVIEAVGGVSERCFDDAVKKTLAQILAYAREEVGVGSDPGKQLALPLGTRFVYRGDPFSLYIVEEEPRVRTIFWGDLSFRLSFPYVIFAVYMKNDEFYNMQTFFRNRRLETQDDKLRLASLPDLLGGESEGLKGNSWVCFPAQLVRGDSPAEVVSSALQVFWGSSFQSNHWRDRDERIPENFSIEKWQELSISEPLEVLKTPWRDTGLSVKKLGNSIRSQKSDGNVRESFSRLEQYVHELGGRLGASLQEAVLESVAASEAPAAARAAFDTELKKAMEETRLAERAGDLIRERLNEACSDDQLEETVTNIFKESCDKFANIIDPAADEAIKEMAKKLRGR